jgi:DNA-binding NarL/FixJ family response regulator
MKRRILAVGHDQMLLSTRVSVLNARWFAKAVSPRETLDALRKESFDLIILCHSIPIRETASLVKTVRKNFPNVRILTLETSAGSASHLNVGATAVTTNGPSQMLDEIEKLLGSNGVGG